MCNRVREHAPFQHVKKNTSVLYEPVFVFICLLVTQASLECLIIFHLSECTYGLNAGSLLVVIERKVGFIRDSLVFSPNEQEISSLLAQLSPTAVLRIAQTQAHIESRRELLFEGKYRTNCIDLTQPMNSIETGMDRTCRYHIRKAARLVDRIEIQRDGSSVRRHFLDLNNRFVRKHGHSRPLSARRLNDYAQHSSIFVLYLDGTPKCGHLLLRDSATARTRLMFSASSRLDSPEDAAVTAPLNRFLHLHEMRELKGEGVSLYDFGGTEDDSGRARFKLSFGGHAVEENRYVLAGAVGALAFKAREALATRSRRAA